MSANQKLRGSIRLASVLLAMTFLATHAAPALAEDDTPIRDGKRYTGKRIDFTAQDMEIHDFLDKMAEVSRRNIVADGNVHGRITIRLRNLPWDEVLDIVLMTQGLGRETIGSIIRVAKIEKLEAEAKRRQR